MKEGILMDDMTIEEREELTSIQTNSRRKSYTLATLRNLYVVSKQDVHQFARQYDLSVSQIRKAIAEGNWDEARLQNIKDAKAKLFARMDQQVEIQAELELKIQALEIIKVEQQVDHLMKHYAQFGDLFIRNLKTGEIEYTQSGQPKSLAIPSSVQEIMKRKNMTELMQGYKKLMKIQQLESPEAIGTGEEIFTIDGSGLDEAQKLLNMATNDKKE